MKILAVGDMHRKLDMAKQLVSFALKQKYDHIVFVGDYADNFQGNAEDAIELWRFMLDHPNIPEGFIIPLMGNHDFAYAHGAEMELLFGTRKVQSGYDPMTALSVTTANEKEMAEKFALSTEIDGVTYSHAGFSQRWLDEEKIRKERAANFRGNQELADVEALFSCQYSPIWQRPADSYLGLAKAMSKTQRRMFEVMKPSPYPKDKKQVFGHTPVTACINLHIDGDCWCIDTFSQHPSGDFIGDRSVLEIIDGKEFSVIPEDVWR